MNTVKKILYISYDGMTDPLGQSQVIPYLEGLSKKGYHITLLSFEKRHRYDKLGVHIQQLLDGGGIEWVPQFFSVRPPLLSKVYDQWKMKRISGQLNKSKKFDLIHCRSYVAAAAGLHLYKKYGVPFLFDMRGFWVDERVDSGQWKLSNPLYRILYKRYKLKEKQYFKKAAGIISLTQKGKGELINVYGVPETEIVVIPCCVDLNHFNYENIPQEEQDKKRSLLGLSKTNRILSYLGSLGGSYLIDEMLLFFIALKKKDQQARFLFITQDAKESVMSKAQSKNIDPGDIIIQAVQRNEVPLYLSLSNWSIFFYKNTYSRKACSPAKQGEIMAMGIPVICNDIGDTGKIVKESGGGIVIDDFTPAAYERVTGSIEDLLQIDRSDIRKSAYKYYNLQKGIEQYCEVYEKILK